MIVGLTGPKGVGKTTLTNALIDTLRSKQVVELSFATPIREMIKALGVSMGDYTTASKEQPVEGLGKSLRYIMQTLGTEWGRNTINDSIWLWAMDRQIESYQIGDPLFDDDLLFVIDDVRFENEAAYVRRRGGVVIELTREGISYTGEHSSESGLGKEFVDITMPIDDIQLAAKKVEEKINFVLTSQKRHADW